jgi:hypothetical protein
MSRNRVATESQLGASRDLGPGGSLVFVISRKCAKALKVFELLYNHSIGARHGLEHA